MKAFTCKMLRPDSVFNTPFRPAQRLCFRYTDIVQYPFVLNPKFQASSHLLRQYGYRPVCIRPGLKHRRPAFSRRGSCISVKNDCSRKLSTSQIIFINFIFVFRICLLQINLFVDFTEIKITDQRLEPPVHAYSCYITYQHRISAKTVKN